MSQPAIMARRLPAAKGLRAGRTMAWSTCVVLPPWNWPRRRDRVSAVTGCPEVLGHRSAGNHLAPARRKDHYEGMPENRSSVAPTVVRLPQYTKADQDEILGASGDPFGVASTGLTWLPKEVHFGVRHEGRLVAHVGLLRLPVVIGEARTEVVGVGGVAVASAVRGQGLARLTVTAALEHARTMGPRHALLFCRPPLVPLYQRLGWHSLDSEVLVEQPEAHVVAMSLQTMVTPLRDEADWPSGPVRLLSLPM